MARALTADEVRRIFEATDLAEANRVAAELERERQERREAEDAKRCYWHARLDCGRCKEGIEGEEV